jgi:CRP/FNR family transcriptional regulator, cyclic AMP receptor protein
MCHVLREDLDLADAVPPDRRDQAIEDCSAREVGLTPGPWPEPGALAADAIGYLVLEGLLIRRVSIEGRFAVELLGECDLLRPWQAEDTQTLPLKARWYAVDPVRLALLDGRFTRQLGRYPELAGRLFERAIRRSRRAVVNMAIIHQARVDDRLHMLFWHFAARWGRVRGDGVLLPLRLTHTVLADLVAARRPTVTSALSDLSKRGLVRAVDEGWLLLGDAPTEASTLAVTRENAGTRDSAGTRERAGTRQNAGVRAPAAAREATGAAPS